LIILYIRIARVAKSLPVLYLPTTLDTFRFPTSKPSPRSPCCDPSPRLAPRSAGNRHHAEYHGHDQTYRALTDLLGERPCSSPSVAAASSAGTIRHRTDGSGDGARPAAHYRNLGTRSHIRANQHVSSPDLETSSLAGHEP